MKRSGYKEMLRDRISDMQAINLALKYCGVKTKWIDHVYSNFVGLYLSKHERDLAVRTILGITKKNRFQFDFHKTIAWDNLTTEEIEYWNTIEDWVNWFSNNMLIIENEMYLGYTDEQIVNMHNDLKTINNPLELLGYIRESITDI